MIDYHLHHHRYYNRHLHHHLHLQLINQLFQGPLRRLCRIDISQVEGTEYISEGGRANILIGGYNNGLYGNSIFFK
jgi:hypothetical protein